MSRCMLLCNCSCTSAARCHVAFTTCSNILQSPAGSVCCTGWLLRLRILLLSCLHVLSALAHFAVINAGRPDACLLPTRAVCFLLALPTSAFVSAVVCIQFGSDQTPEHLKHPCHTAGCSQRLCCVSAVTAHFSAFVSAVVSHSFAVI
jgi:hypothetical protein